VPLPLLCLTTLLYICYSIYTPIHPRFAFATCPPVVAFHAVYTAHTTPGHGSADSPDRTIPIPRTLPLYRTVIPDTTPRFWDGLPRCRPPDAVEPSPDHRPHPLHTALPHTRDTLTFGLTITRCATPARDHGTPPTGPLRLWAAPPLRTRDAARGR